MRPRLTLGEQQLLTFKNLVALGWPYSRVHTRRLVAAGKCPAPADLGDNRLVWDAAEIASYLQGRFANREASAARRSEVAKKRQNKSKPVKSKKSTAANERETAEV